MKIFARSYSFCMLVKFHKLFKVSESFSRRNELKSHFLRPSRNRLKHTESSSRSFAVKDEYKSTNGGLCNHPENKFAEMRSHTCSSLRESDIGSEVYLCGWLQFSRMGKFATLRDGYGCTQIIIPEERRDLSRLLDATPFESVLAVKGQVVKRPSGQENLNMTTGSVEVLADNISVLNPAKKNMPFSIREFNKAKETLQMKYRYLSLRFPELQYNLRLRSHTLNLMREFLIHKCAFVEVETPTLFRKTPGGAQEFLVPAQLKGHFYSLVQSPQQLKQLLMIGAIDRYFQVARCYRDETARPDRQPEFTQMDIEISFSNREGVMHLVEELLEHSWHSTIKKTNTLPFPRITYNYAMANYGSDKPDIRFGLKLVDVSKILLSHESDSKPIELLKQNSSHVAVCFNVPEFLEQGLLSRSNFRKFEESLRKSLVNVSSVRLFPERIQSTNNSEDQKALQKLMDANCNGWIVTAVGPKDEVLPLLGRLRLMVADHLESKGIKIRAEGFSFLWVVDFPLFLPVKKENGKSAMEAAHHPFTQPHPDDFHLLESKPLEVRGLHYDLVCNGCEVGGGSVRIHDAALQSSILDMLDIDKNQLSHLMEALSCGCPPHAGIALGVDRIIALAVGADSVREVIAFPKGSEGQDIMSGAPSTVSQEDLDIYHLKIK